MKPIAKTQICWTLMVALVAPALQAQNQPKLTARELFYTPVQTAQAQTPANNTTPKQTTVADAKNTAPKQTGGRKNSSPKGSTTNVVDPPYLDAKNTPKSNNVPKTYGSGGTEVPMMNVANTSSGPLAIRYSVMKLVDGDYEEVLPTTVFRSGDKIRIAVEANDTGYLYIVQRGSSKTWSVLFPNSDYENGNNRITAVRRQVIPGKARFTFDDTPGTERIFLVFARKPEPDLEKLIYKLSGGDDSKPEAKPASTPSESAAPKVMMASAKLDDPFVDRLRAKLVSRDLVFETVDDTRAEKKDTATYVATPDRSADARVVAEFKLEHR
jgi:hypothetical protein